MEQNLKPLNCSIGIIEDLVCPYSYLSAKLSVCLLGAKLSKREMCSTDVCQVNGKFARVCLFICPFRFVVFVVLVFLFGFDFVFELVN